MTDITLYDFAMRFVGISEIAGPRDEPFIRWCHASTTMGEMPDEVPWCSSFINRLAWMLRLPRSKSASARSWLSAGYPIVFHEARIGYDVVILKRGSGPGASSSVEPNADGTWPPGHVGLFAGWQDEDHVLVLGGNQGDSVNIRPFPIDRILGIRRLA